MPSYDLIDAEALCRRDPFTHKIPSLQDRKELADHCWVELGFKSGGTVERMLVQVNEREEGHDIYYGKLGQVPVDGTKVSIGDEIQFTSKNIFSIILGE